MQAPIRPLPSVAYLRECFDYDPMTGELRWRARPREHFTSDQRWRRSNTLWSGKTAGHNDGKRIVVALLGRYWRVNRVIWKMTTGGDPGEYIDHKDRDPFNNRWANLREATHTQNRRNCNNQKGRDLPKGVHRHGHRFRARIVVDRKHIHLGNFTTSEEAHAAYCAAAARADPEFFSPG